MPLRGDAWAPAKPAPVDLENAPALRAPAAPALVGAATSRIDDVTEAAGSAVGGVATLVTPPPPCDSQGGSGGLLRGLLSLLDGLLPPG